VHYAEIVISALSTPAFNLNGRDELMRSLSKQKYEAGIKNIWCSSVVHQLQKVLNQRDKA